MCNYLNTDIITDHNNNNNNNNNNFLGTDAITDNNRPIMKVRLNLEKVHRAKKKFKSVVWKTETRGQQKFVDFITVKRG